MRRFSIADLVLSIEDESIKLFSNMDDFKSDRSSDSVLNVKLIPVEYINEPDGDLVAQEQITWLCKRPREAGHYVWLPFGRDQHEIGCLLDADAQWQKTAITYLNKNIFGLNDEVFGFVATYLIHMLLGVAFRNCLLHHDGIVIHASSIKWRGKGLIFTAPSGTGKSTHVRLWQKYMGDEVEVLNDDTPAIRFMDGKPFVFGTPWGGSTNVFRNDSAPVEAVVVLQQAAENSITRLNTIEAVSRVTPRFFLPYVDKDLMATALNIVDKILSSVPVYLLKCKPDQEAVELVYNCVK
ncbi:MAG: hypothetical protein ACM3UZ_10960 [Acidobacteriota bacterium]